MHIFSRAVLRHIVTLSVALCPLLVRGASDEFRSYDLSSCEILRISNEPSPDRAYQRMLAEAGDWDVYEFSSPSGGGRGFCKWSGPNYKDRFTTKFLCRQDSRSNFPLAGATYSVIRDSGEVPSYRCVKGCRGDTPKVLHYLGEEPGSQVNIEDTKTLKKFESKCGVSE